MAIHTWLLTYVLASVACLRMASAQRCSLSNAPNSSNAAAGLARVQRSPPSLDYAYMMDTHVAPRASRTFNATTGAIASSQSVFAGGVSQPASVWLDFDSPVEGSAGILPVHAASAPWLDAFATPNASTAITLALGATAACNVTIDTRGWTALLGGAPPLLNASCSDGSSVNVAGFVACAPPLSATRAVVAPCALNATATGGVPCVCPTSTIAGVIQFKSLYLGPLAAVTLRGDIPLILLSRGSAIIDTAVHATPGTLGGAPGAGYSARVQGTPVDSRGVSSAVNGMDVDLGGATAMAAVWASLAMSPCDAASPSCAQRVLQADGAAWGASMLAGSVLATQAAGSSPCGAACGATRTRLYTLVLSTALAPASFRITISSATGQSITGMWRLCVQMAVGGNCVSTRALSATAEADDVRRAVFQDIDGIGDVTVIRRDYFNASVAPRGQSGFAWTLTLLCTDGAAPNVTAVSDTRAPLTAVQLAVNVAALSGGGSLRGSAALTFRNVTSAPFDAAMPSDAIASLLSSSWTAVGVTRVSVWEHPIPTCAPARASPTAFPSDAVATCRPAWSDTTVAPALRVLYLAVEDALANWLPAAAAPMLITAAHDAAQARIVAPAATPTVAVLVEGYTCLPPMMQRSIAAAANAFIPSSICTVMPAGNFTTVACAAVPSATALLVNGSSLAAWVPTQLLQDVLTPHARVDRSACVAPAMLTRKLVYNSSCGAACTSATAAVTLHSIIASIGGSGGTGPARASNASTAAFTGGSGGAAGARSLWEFAALMDASLRAAAVATTPSASPLLALLLPSANGANCTLQWQHVRANVSSASTYSDDVSGDGDGGAGGAALAIVSGTDVILGPNAAVSCAGQDGHAALRAGGGGAGGALLLSAPGTVSIQGYVAVHGGRGGNGTAALTSAALPDATRAVVTCLLTSLQSSTGPSLPSTPACDAVYAYFGIAGAGGSSGRLSTRSGCLSIAPQSTVVATGGSSGAAILAQLEGVIAAGNVTSTDMRTSMAFLRFLCRNKADVAWYGLPAILNATNTSSVFPLPTSTVAFFSALVLSSAAWMNATSSAQLSWLCGSPASNASGIDVVAATDTYAELVYDAGACAMGTSGCLHLRSAVSSAPGTYGVSDHVRNGFIAPIATSNSSSTALAVLGPTLASLPSLPPSRVSLQVRVVSTTSSAACGAHVALLTSNVSIAVVGAAVLDGQWYHDSGYTGLPQRPIPSSDPMAGNSTWRRVDIFLSWNASMSTYTLRVDGVSLAVAQPFVPLQAASVGAFVTGIGCDVWIDELFVGADDSMGFECPSTATPGAAPTFAASKQSDWNATDLGPVSQAWPMQHHASHLSARLDFADPWHAGLAAYDGQPVRAYLADFDAPGGPASVPSQQLVSTATGKSTLPSLQPYDPSTSSQCAMLSSVGGYASRVQAGAWTNVGSAAAMPCGGVPAATNASRVAVMHAGSLLTVPTPLASVNVTAQATPPARKYWYIETDNQLGWDMRPYMRGGMGACSSVDMVTWRNEGIQLHWANLTFNSTPGAINGGNATYDLRGERPRVLRNTNASAVINCTSLVPSMPPYNSSNSSSSCGYIMWAFAWNAYAAAGVNTTRDSIVAVSSRPTGPFYMLRVDRPDGNDTVDFTVWQPGSAARGVGAQPAVALRTFYATTAAYMPGPVMQPIWQSVQLAGSAANNPDFALNYHRAFYHERYDSPTDTYLQVWRMEDQAWNMSLGSLQEVFDVFTGNFTLTTLAGDVVAAYSPFDREAALSMYVTAHAYVSIQGQGRPLPVHSRFLDPRNAANSAWMPSSVPAVKAQPWGANYRDKNIADNPPIHTLPDLLIAEYHAVEFRRAKYVAAWALDASLTQSVRLLGVREGSLTDGAFLIQAVVDDDLFAPAVLRTDSPVLQYSTASLIDSVSAARDLLDAGAGLNSSSPASTYKPDLIASVVVTPSSSSSSNLSAISFATAPDWRDRLWQFNATLNDRALDFRNFRDRQTSSACPDLHHAVIIVFQECQRIVVEDLRWVDATSMTNASMLQESYARGMDTSTFEACIAVHDAIQVRYSRCVAAGVPDFARMRDWDVNDRECVGGGGLCGPPAAPDDNMSQIVSGFSAYNASTLARMCVAVPLLNTTRVCNGTALDAPYQVPSNRDLVAEDVAQKRFIRFPPT